MKIENEYGIPAHNIIECAKNIIIAVDCNQIIIGFNPAAEESFGYDRSEVIGYPIDRLLPNSNNLSKARNVLLQYGNCRQQMDAKSKTGRLFSITMDISMVYDQNGKKIGASGIGSDVRTEEMRDPDIAGNLAKLKGLNELTHLLARTRNRDAVIQNCIDIARDVFTADRVTLFSYDEHRETLSPLATNGKHAREVMKLKLKLGEGVTGRTILERKARIVNRVDLTNEGRHIPDTPTEPESLMCAPLKIDHTIIGALLLSKLGGREFLEDDLAYLINLADLSSVAIHVSQLFEELKLSNSIKDRFLANISHEIRTPLTSILGFTDILKQTIGTRINVKQEECFHFIDSASSRLLRTVDEMINVANLEYGTIHLSLTSIHLGEMVISIFEELQPAAEEKGLNLESSFDCTDDLIIGDHDSISHAIYNIVQNAINYTSEGHVRVFVKDEGNAVVISIQDTGIGMSEEFQQRLFQPFSQESEGFTKNYQGIGLGLAMAKRYLDLNDVTLIVNSERGVGSTFSLYFYKT